MPLDKMELLNPINSLTSVYNSILNGDLTVVREPEFQVYMTNLALIYIRNGAIVPDDTIIMDLLLRISNFMYNNTTDETLPLDDGVYDQLLEQYKIYSPNYQVGAIPYVVPEVPHNEIIDNKIMCTVVTDEEKDSRLFVKDIHEQNVPMDQGVKKRTMCVIAREPITKRLINTQHNYPELVGTLDKCKFVLNNDARLAEVFDKDDTVKVFERDFIHKCLDLGIITPEERFQMVGELKYDGVSVEATVRDGVIISALSRGDTADNIATDLTPIFGGYRFPNYSYKPIFTQNGVMNNEFGIKFEAVMLKRDMEYLGMLRGRTYKNCRNAIIGLLGASDAYRYVNYITLIPLASSLELNRLEDLWWLNTFYHSGQYNRFAVFEGNYQQILFQVKDFYESANIMRKILPYMIDGIVVSFTDPNKINRLGRVNSVNKYSMAIKFSPKSVRTIFLGYTFNIGKSGEVIPMAHFKPCEFNGTIHTKQTIHSYQRFKELNLIKGQQIDITYVNEVITYVTKPDNEYNRKIEKNAAIPEMFIKTCPYCGSMIAISESGKSAKCTNPHCPEREIFRMTAMLDKLGFTDFSEETIRSTNIRSFTDLIKVEFPDVYDLGPTNCKKFLDNIERLKSNPIPDYKFMAALGFDDIAEEKWKKILSEYTISDLVFMDSNKLVSSLSAIKSIGEITARNVYRGIRLYEVEILDGTINLNIIDSKNQVQLPKVSFSGFRSDELVKLLKDNGYDAGDYGVTKNTYALIVDSKATATGKVAKAEKYNIPIYTMDEFIEVHNIVVNN